MEDISKASIKTIKKKATGSILGRMGESIVDLGRIIKCMVLATLLGPMVK